jgi:PleD family two-component response regulator
MKRKKNPNKRKKILLIDHHPSYHFEAINNLKKEYKVKVVHYISTALVKLGQKKYDLIIIEIRLAYLNLYTPEETDDGLKTGIIFYERELEKRGVPVMFWSGADSCQEEIAQIKEKNPRVCFVLKEANGYHLLKAVNDFLVIYNKK